ncbi:hypothetical protein FH972_026646 [Carpinus fangiana]|uniref:Ubiquitin 3 binding protein But2 C-terminal domain-containing protein n=1 Tax=Carpinus fangiana TaxID=176857 RepID=A0A5N6L4W7_9ROSI|nr:hypothetical protein FH972_026646 [Carpinus fangiana]
MVEPHYSPGNEQRKSDAAETFNEWGVRCLFCERSDSSPTLISNFCLFPRDFHTIPCGEINLWAITKLAMSSTCYCYLAEMLRIGLTLGFAAIAAANPPPYGVADDPAQGPATWSLQYTVSPQAMQAETATWSLHYTAPSPTPVPAAELAYQPPANVMPAAKPSQSCVEQENECRDGPDANQAWCSSVRLQCNDKCQADDISCRMSFNANQADCTSQYADCLGTLPPYVGAPTTSTMGHPSAPAPAPFSSALMSDVPPYDALPSATPPPLAAHNPGTQPVLMSKRCPLDLSHGSYQYPHAIYHVRLNVFDTTLDSQYNGEVSDMVCSAFNFDIPYHYDGMNCTVAFTLPKHGTMQTNDYIMTDGMKIEMGMLKDSAVQGMTFMSMSRSATGMHMFNATEGSLIQSNHLACPAGKQLAVGMCGRGGTLKFFQDFNSCPVSRIKSLIF